MGAGTHAESKGRDDTATEEEKNKRGKIDSEKERKDTKLQT